MLVYNNSTVAILNYSGASLNFTPLLGSGVAQTYDLDTRYLSLFPFLFSLFFFSG